ncbi:hypothetical protein ACK3TF_001725 [Chlorella vulgaris]
MLRAASRLVPRLVPQADVALGARSMALQGMKGYDDKEAAEEEDERVLRRLLSKVRKSAEQHDVHAAAGSVEAEKSALKSIVSKYNISDDDSCTAISNATRTPASLRTPATTPARARAVMVVRASAEPSKAQKAATTLASLAAAATLVFGGAAPALADPPGVVESLSAQQDSALKDPDFSRNMPGVDTRAPAVSLPGAVAREEKAKQSIGFDPAEKVKDKAGKIGDAIKDAVEGVPEGTKNAAKDAAKGAARAAPSNIKQGASALADKVSSDVSGSAKGAKNAVEDAANKAGDAVQSAGNRAAAKAPSGNFFSKLFGGGATRDVKNAAGDAKNAANRAVDNAGQTANNITSDVKAAVNPDNLFKK